MSAIPRTPLPMDRGAVPPGAIGGDDYLGANLGEPQMIRPGPGPAA
jgi:hypothetical protein